MKKYIKIGILVLIALIFIGTFVFLYQKSQPKDTKYDIQKVETTNLVQTTVATGKLEPRDEVQIKPQISGIIAEVYKEAGEKVKKGEVIAKSKGYPRTGTTELCRKPCPPGRNERTSGRNRPDTYGKALQR